MAAQNIANLKRDSIVYNRIKNYHPNVTRVYHIVKYVMVQHIQNALNVTQDISNIPINHVLSVYVEMVLEL